MEFGSILSGIGTIAGGFGLGRGGGDGIDVSENVRLNDAMNSVYRNNIGLNMQAMVKGAKSAGLHPVYAMGYRGPGQQVLSTGGSKGGSADPGAIGAGLGGIAQGLKSQKQDPTAKAMQALGLREAAQAADQSEIQTEMMRLQLHKERQAAVAEPRTPAPAGSPGKPTRPPLFVEYVNPYNGKIEVLPNPEAGLEMPETLGGVYYGQGKYHQNSRGGQVPSPTRPSFSPRGGRQFRVPQGPKSRTGGF